MSFHHRDDAWFVAQLKPNAHELARRNLAQQGFRVFLPLHEETRQARGRFVTRVRPLFPGYIFVALNTAEAQWRAVSATRGITRLISLGAAPTPVPRPLIHALMQRCDQRGHLVAQPERQPGDLVKLATGPFAELVGTVESIASDQRIWVLLECMGQQARVAVPRAQLQNA